MFSSIETFVVVCQFCSGPMMTKMKALEGARRPVIASARLRGGGIRDSGGRGVVWERKRAFPFCLGKFRSYAASLVRELWEIFIFIAPGKV